MGERAELGRPPVFIVVCNNTSTSKLVYDWISGYEITEDEGDKKQTRVVKGALRLFSNVDENGRWLPRFRTFSSTARSLNRARRFRTTSVRSPAARSRNSSANSGCAVIRAIRTN